MSNDRCGGIAIYVIKITRITNIIHYNKPKWQVFKKKSFIPIYDSELWILDIGVEYDTVVPTFTK